jgi:8-oxo-dGTP pyrophosphatase MutT (NUDIX family)
VDRLPDPYTCTAAVLLVRREAGGPLLAVRGPRGLGFPGGKREPWESPIACALREAREECGLELSAAAARYIGIARVTPRAFASYDMADAIPFSKPTTTGRPLSFGSFATSTEAKKASPSRCKIMTFIKIITRD